MNFNVIITDEGRALLTTIINNNYWLYIDQPRMSENNYVGQEVSLTEATFDGVFTYGTAAKSIIDATTLRLKISFDNNYLVADHDLYTIGVIARAVDPDTHQTVGSDALLAVCTTNTPTPIPAGASYYSQWAYNVNLSVGSTQNMTVVATQAGVQYVDLTTPLTINGNTENTVEDALDGLNDYGDALADNLAANENVYGAKNLNSYPYYETTKNVNGITFTDNGDGTITVSSGTASAAIVFYCHYLGVGDFVLEDGNYIVDGCPSGGSAGTYCLLARYVKNDNSNFIKIDTGNGIDFSVSEGLQGENKTFVSLYISIENGTVISTPITFKPMIRDARIVDPTFAPYAETNLQLTQSKAERDDLSTIHATGSTNTTGAQIDAGTFFYLNGQFCKALTNIAVNATFTLNTNFEVITVGGVIQEEDISSQLTVNTTYFNTSVLVEYKKMCNGLKWLFIYGQPITTAPHDTALMSGFTPQGIHKVCPVYSMTSQTTRFVRIWVDAYGQLMIDDNLATTDMIIYNDIIR